MPRGSPRGPQALSRPERGAAPALRRASRRFEGRGQRGSGGRRRRPATGLRPGGGGNMRPELQVRGPAAWPRRGAGFSERRPPQAGSDSNARGDRLLLGRRRRPGRGVCPQALSRPLPGRGRNPGDRNRTRGAVVRRLGAQQVSEPAEAPSAEPGPLLTRFSVGFSSFDCCWTMLTLLVLLSQLPAAAVALPLGARSREGPGRAGDQGKRGFGFPGNPRATPRRLLRISN